MAPPVPRLWPGARPGLSASRPPALGIAFALVRHCHHVSVAMDLAPNAAAPHRYPVTDTGAYAQLRFFRGVDLLPIVNTLNACARRSVAAGECLLRPGTANGQLFVVLRGRLAVQLEVAKDPGDACAIEAMQTADAIAEIGVGEAVGELSILDHQPTSAFVVAKTPCELLVIDEPTFWMLVDTADGLARNLLFSLAQRLRRNNGTLVAGRKRQEAYKRAGESDALTGLCNRGWLDGELARLVGASVRARRALSLLVLDIDHFKRYNDRFGQLNGDCVLRAVARAMSDNVRPSDLLARFGGEEFIAVLPDTSLKAAALVGERLRRAVADTVVLAEDHTPLPAVTVSLGLAQLDYAQDAAALIAAADRALYRAKHQGRNRLAC